MAASLDPLVASRDDEPSLFGGIIGLFGGMGGGTPRPNGKFVVDFLLLGLFEPLPPSFRAAFGGLIVAMLVACWGATVAWACDMAGVLCIFRGPGLVVANPLLLLALSSVDELARNCWPLTIDRATPVAREETARQRGKIIPIRKRSQIQL